MTRMGLHRVSAWPRTRSRAEPAPCIAPSPWCRRAQDPRQAGPAAGGSGGAPGREAVPESDRSTALELVRRPPSAIISRLAFGRSRGACPAVPSLSKNLARSRPAASPASRRYQRACGRDRGPTRLRSPPGPVHRSRVAPQLRSSRRSCSAAMSSCTRLSARPRILAAVFRSPCAPSPMTTQSGGAAHTMDRFGPFARSAPRP